jgi:hypothetical protein
MDKSIIVTLRPAELLLFFFAFAMLVPAVPSNGHEVYPFMPTLVIGGGACALSLLLAVWRKAETWLTAALKLLFYIGLAWIIHERVFALE